MSGERAFVVLAICTTLGTLGVGSAAGNEIPDRDDLGGAVVRCSLAGVNPAHHPEIFGNPATAKAYGFVQSRDGTWQVQPNCRAENLKR